MWIHSCTNTVFLDEKSFMTKAPAELIRFPRNSGHLFSIEIIKIYSIYAESPYTT